MTRACIQIRFLAVFRKIFSDFLRNFVVVSGHTSKNFLKKEQKFTKKWMERNLNTGSRVSCLHKYFVLLTLSFLLLLSSECLSKPYFEEKIEPSLLDRPFQKNSAEWSEEVEQILEFQENFDEKEVAEASEEDDFTTSLITEKVDKNLTQKNYPQLYKLLERSEETSEKIAKNAKKYWKTERPFTADKRVKALINPHHSSSYPSGHTTESYVQAHILGLLFPQKREEFQKRAEEISWHRVLTGMHYPKDLSGGQQLALLILGGLLQNADFQEDFVEAKEEIEKFKCSK